MFYGGECLQSKHEETVPSSVLVSGFDLCEASASRAVLLDDLMA